MNQLRVVVADDQALMREGLVQLLRLLGDIDVVAVAADGEEALQQIRELSPAVALLDVRMPKLTGLQVLQRLRQEEHPCAVILLTTFDDDEVLLRAIKAGARGYLLKDGTEQDLAAHILNLRSGGSPMSPIIARQVLAQLGSTTAPTAPTAPRDTATGQPLSPKETEVLTLVARGFSYAETANLLGISVHTVHSHVRNIYGKLSVNSKTEAVYEARQLGLL